MNKYEGIGRIASIDHKPVPNNNDGLTICRISVPINIWTPGRNGQDGTEETMWVELTAFGSPSDKFNQAQAWADKYQKGDVVWVTGTPKLRAFMKTNKDTGEKEPAAAMVLTKMEIGKVPQNRQAETVGVGATNIDELPF